jgi:hypothetical protein
MNIYNAIMLAADWIERHPKQHSYVYPSVPDSPEDKGCPLAWIGYFAQPGKKRFERKAYTARVVAPHILGVNEATFFSRMDSLQPWYRLNGAWKRSAKIAIRCMRLYAENYHAPAKPVTPPDWNAMSAKWAVGDDVRSQEVSA